MRRDWSEAWLWTPGIRDRLLEVTVTDVVEVVNADVYLRHGKHWNRARRAGTHHCGSSGAVPGRGNHRHDHGAHRGRGARVQAHALRALPGEGRSGHRLSE